MKKYLTVILFLCLLGSLYDINRDLFCFEYHDVRERLFSPDNDAKGFYNLGEAISLKHGQYTLTITGDLPENQCEIVIRDDHDELLFQKEFEVLNHESVFNFVINTTTHNAQILLNYEPKSGPVRIDHIKLTSDHVLTKESLLIHGFESMLLLLICCVLIIRLENPNLLFRLFPSLSNKENEKDLLLLIILTLVVSIPLLVPNMHLEGFDLYFHLNRFQGIAANLKADLFPPRVELHWMDNVGYGVGFYYPEIFLVIPAIFLLIGFPLVSVYKTTGVLIVFFTLLSHYWSAKKLSKGNRKAGISAAIFIALSVYRIEAHFLRNGLGEAIAIIFLPLIAAGLHQIFQQDKDGWKTLSAGFVGTLLSHVLSFVLAVIFIALFLITQIRKMLKNHKIFGDLWKAAVFSICLTAFFLFPMLEQKYAVPDLKINQITAGKMDMTYATGVQSAEDLLIFGQEPHENPIIFYPGWNMLFVPFIALFLWMKKKKELRAAHIMTISAVLIMIASTDIFPWNLIQFFLNTIQFSFRLLQSATVLLSLAGGLYIASLCENRTKPFVLGIQFLVCLISVIPVYNILYHDFFKSSVGFIVQNDTTYGSEYMPPQLTRPYIKSHIDKVEDTAGTSQITGFRRDDLSISYDFTSETDGHEISFIVPFIYYKGYCAEIQNLSGGKSEVVINADDSGFVHVQADFTPVGHVRVWYKGTVIQRISDLVSLVTFLGWMIVRRKIQDDLFCHKRMNVKG